MKIGYLQNAPLFGEKQKNFEAVYARLKDLQADLIVLPELFATGYTFTSEEEVRSMAELPDGPTAAFLSELSVMTGAVVVGGMVEREFRQGAEQCYNAALIAANGKVVDTYRKVHLFNREKHWFSPGDKPFRVYETKGFRLGVMICFDWMFPEVSRTLALQGMQVLAHPSNLVLPYAQKAMVTRCLENRIFAVTANRIGREQRGEDDFTFTGGSQITGPDGRILSSAPTDQPGLSIVEADLTLADQKMINEFNDVIKDRRTQFYL